jgi:uncharacterized damage-inducible protein DinB
MGASAPAPAPGTMIDPAKALGPLLTTFESEVTGVALEMPADKYSFAPSSATFAATQGAKFGGVRTFAEQVAHLAEANYYFYGAATGLKPDINPQSILKMKTKDELVNALAASFVYAHKAIATITAANAFEAIKPVDGQTTRATLAAFAVAHGYDHYGQMVEYLRMNGLVPPGSK